MICVDADKLERGIREFTDGNGEIIGMFLTDFHLLLEKCAIKRRSIRPSDNLTEVVRCKDCRYNYANIIPNGSGCSNNVELKAEAEWYCADGERDE